VGDGDTPVAGPRRRTPDDRRRALAFNLNTCHVWAEGGEMVSALSSGDDVPLPLWARERMVSLGRDPDEWMLGMHTED
jgi:hypothetical protein